MKAPAPHLSVVIPSLDEVSVLPGLIEALSRQAGVCVEVVVADGGSRDGTLAACHSAAARLGFPLVTVEAPRGRGRQMNLGARSSSAPDVFFLHADSIIEDDLLLARARERMEAERRRRGSRRLAGHFGLHFVRSEPGESGVYYFFEAKARLDRPGCRNGDQGFWLCRDYFEDLGGFDESLPYMEDTRLAARVSETGTWVTLPGRLGTSARRFETEGLKQRQALNALLRVFDTVGLDGFFEGAAGAYREQSRVARLRLGPFLALAHRAAWTGGLRRAAGHWYSVGRYVAANAWQLAFAVDCAWNRRRGYPPGEGPTPWLDGFDRWAGPPCGTAPVGAVAAVLAALCLYGALGFSLARETRKRAQTR
jgi:glycosyltransferase involved in cell wall biosynthesis